MKQLSTFRKQQSHYLNKAFLAFALLFALSFASMGQSPYCSAPYYYNYGNCTYYYHSINAFEVLEGSTQLYYRAHNTGGMNGCNGKGDYELFSGTGGTSLFSMKKGSTYEMGFTTGPYDACNFFIWIDLNKDNDFGDKDEFISAASSTSPQCSRSGVVPAGSSKLTYYTLTIPGSATGGNTRMRIRSTAYYNGCLGSSDAGCSDLYTGECEDYIINIASDPNDASITKVNQPQCDNVLSVILSNIGSNDITPVQVGWSVNGSFQKTNPYTSLLKSGASVSLTLSPAFTFVDGVTYKLKVFTFDPNNINDVDKKNDTLTSTFVYIGTSGTPTTSPTVKCGPGKAPLMCTTPFKTDSVVWYNAATGGNKIGSGRNTLSPPLFLGVNTFYAQSFKISKPNKLENSLLGNYTYVASGYTYNGGFADITPNTDMFLDSFKVRLYTNAAANFIVRMRTGTYVGNMSVTTGWTVLVNDISFSPKTVSGYFIATVKIPEVMLTKGTTYGFHIYTTTRNPLWTFMYGSNTVSNADMTLYTQDYCFGNTTPYQYTGYYYPINLEVNYRIAVCPSPRVPATITVKPSPNSAEWKKSTPFQTTQLTTNGTLGTPDVVAKGDQLTYDLVPPKTYQTIGHGTSWQTFTPVVTTKKGANILQSSGVWKYNPPVGSAPGQLIITPTAAYEDELLIVSMRIEDMGPHYCDSTILKHIYIAPRPNPDFKFNSPICDGDAVLFSDKSTILAGPLSYKWDFNTGNPGDTGTTSDIVFTFPTFGTYNVKLTAISKLYGYSDTKIYPVVVTEIPKVDFKVLNACEKVPVTFKNNTTIGVGTIAYDWDFGDPSTTLDKSTLKEPGWIYASPNAYKVTLRASANGCAISLSKNANQFATPKALFTYPGLMCDKSDILFTNASTIKSGNLGYNWNFGDGGISNFASPTHQFATFAPKTIKLKAVSEFGCIDSFIKTISLFEAPLADFTWGSACNLSNTDFLFTGTKPSGSITNFNWDFSEGAPSTLENPSKKFDVVSRKQVTLNLTSNNGCSNSITKEVNVKLQSKAQFNIKDVCEDDDAVFVNTSIVTAGNLIYNWKFGDGTNSASQSPRHRYIINGVSQTFNITLVAIVPGGCSDSTTASVNVNAKPKSDFSFTTSGRHVNFTAAQTTNTIYQWRFGDGGSSTSTNTQYDYVTFPTGKYTACLAVINAAGCFSETCKDVLITGGIDRITKLSGVKIYPNPNKGNFTITVEDPKSDISIAVYSLLGDVVKTIETSQLKSTYSVDLNVANGVYMVKVTNGGLISTQKVTINK